MKVKLDTIDTPQVAELLRQHLQGMHAQTPPESVHALNLSAYHSPHLKLWSAWEENQVVGCGALQDLGDGHGEIKSMRTKNAFLRRGVAAAILNAIVDYAQQHKFRRLSLETGATEHFSAAHAFYRKRGFVETTPFGSYQPDPHSLFFTLTLDA